MAKLDHIDSQDSFNIKVLGGRLKQIRCYLNLTQQELAKEIGHFQTSVSNLENGKGVTIEFLLDILKYYSRFVHIGNIFSKEFFLIDRQKHEEDVKFRMDWMVLDIISQAGKEYVHKRKLLDRDFENKLERAKFLLKEGKFIV